jgi:hypothetical protein
VQANCFGPGHEPEKKGSPMVENPINVSKEWVWVLDVVFGGIITLGYQELEKALRISIQTSRREFFIHVFVAFSFVFFVIYDISFYHVLITIYPFNISALSGSRYVLDLLMAFALLNILMRGLSYESPKFTSQILVAISLWHLCAAGWHFAASIEKTHQPPTLAAFLPHFAFIALYWLVLFIWFVLSKWRGWSNNFQEAMNSKGYLLLLSLCVLFISFYRSAQLFHIFG